MNRNVRMHWVRILALAILGGGFSAIILRHGLLATEDSWAYWETSVSLLEHHRYTFLHGQPFLMEPPGISLCLAIAQAIFGTTGAGLIATVCVFNFITITLWLVFLGQVFVAAGLPTGKSAYWIAAIFVASFVPLSCFAFVPNIVLLPLIAVVFMLCLRAASLPWPQNIRWIVLLGLSVAACSLFHNSGVLLAPAGLLALFPAFRRQPLVQQIKAAGLFMSLALGPYFILWSRGFKAHASSGSKQFMPILQRAIERAPECIVSFGDLFLPQKRGVLFQAVDFLIGFALFAWMCWVSISLLRERGNRTEAESAFRVPGSVKPPVAVVVAFALLFALAHYAVFALVYEPGPLGGRYFWYLPLAVIGPLCIWMARWRSPAIIAIFCVFLFAPKVWRSALFIRQSAVATARSFPAYHGTIYPEYFLTSNPVAAPPAGRIAVQPPTFIWMDRWKAGINEAEQKLVHPRPLQRTAL